MELCFKAFLYVRKEIQFDLIDQPHQPVKKALGNYSNQVICFLIATRAITPHLQKAMNFTVTVKNGILE